MAFGVYMEGHGFSEVMSVGGLFSRIEVGKSPLQDIDGFEYRRRNLKRPDGIDVYKIINGEEVLWVYTKKSEIPNAGLGLFAGRDFDQNDVIGMYCGEVLLESRTMMERAPIVKPNDYIIGLKDLGSGRMEYVDGHVCASEDYVLQKKKFHKGTVGSPDAMLPMMNDLPEHSNVTMYNNRMCVASRPIKKGEELYMSYGQEYWQFSTPPLYHIELINVPPDLLKTSLPCIYDLKFVTFKLMKHEHAFFIATAKRSYVEGILNPNFTIDGSFYPPLSYITGRVFFYDNTSEVHVFRMNVMVEEDSTPAYISIPHEHISQGSADERPVIIHYLSIGVNL